MNAAEIIALVAVGVTGLSIVTNHLQTGKRLDHDERMMDKRLAHDRREAVKTTAADVYQKAGEVLRWLNENRIYAIVQDKDKGQLVKAVDAMDAARESSAVVAALGWSTEVRDGASAVFDELHKLGSRFSAAAGAIKSGTPTEKDAVAEVEAQTQRLMDAMEQYRNAITQD